MIPHLLTASHATNDFSCASEAMNQWFRNQALTNNLSGASKTFVLPDADNAIIGFYSLCNAAIERANWAKRTHGLPMLIPVTLLARWAVDRRYEGKGYGKILFEDAINRAIDASKIVGSMAIITHPIDARAREIYGAFGFRPLHGDENAMFLPFPKLA